MLALVALTACTNPDPKPLPTATTEPVFANEEEALAAVTTLVQTFVTTINAISADGGADAERLRSVLANDLAETEIAGFASMAEKGWHTEGDATLKRTELAQWWPRPDAVNVVAVVRVCIDYSMLDVLGPDGSSVVRPERDELRAAELRVIADTNELLISTKEPLEGSEICS